MLSLRLTTRYSVYTRFKYAWCEVNVPLPSIDIEKRNLELEKLGAGETDGFLEDIDEEVLTLARRKRRRVADGEKPENAWAGSPR